MSTQRLGRIADQIQRELAELVRLELRDPRVRLVTLTGVELSRDQSHAKVFFTTLGPARELAECLEGLQRAAGFLRSSLSRRLTTRKVPELHFTHDASVEHGVRLSRLIDEAVAAPPVKVASAPKARAGRAPKAPAAKTAKAPAAKTPKAPAAKTPKAPAAKTAKAPKPAAARRKPRTAAN